MLAAYSYYAGQSATTPTLFRNEVEKQVLREFLGYDRKRKDVYYVEEAIMSIVRLDPCVETAVCCFLEKGTRGRLCPKKYPDLYRRMPETTTKHLIGNVKEFLELWFCEKVPVEEGG